ncbi:flagellar motor switch protein FliG [Cellulomonas marina]|uniref:Flagellar motor switch protein FliG n=1 Tax=Cellulomonas marina TaxID=988821 RepID=A0A1I0WI17_9CELL|nr:flagellar motor switch protein FliG [Cellulomonas marina]GIG27662.1 flagellar motor switch protein FliG [Cellulomonas marina]SFA88204.1 flagellar motor switch protein FliG [Cellulomonas marina]
MSAVATLTGPQKAAMLLLQLGKERAGKVMARMELAEIEELTAEILRLQHVDQALADQVLEEFYDVTAAGPGIGGGVGLAQHLLEASLGRDQAADVLQRLQATLAPQPFEFLQQADARQVLSLLDGEHPQTVALVLAHLRPEMASGVLGALDADMQAEVAHRIALMERAMPDVVATIAEVLQRKASAVLTPKEMAAVGGVQPLVEIINRAGPSAEKIILEGLRNRDEGLAEQVRSLMFVFADITLLDDRAMQLVLRQVETSSLSVALKGTSDEVRDKVLRNLSERARENLLEEIELLGPTRLSQVEEARAGVVQAIRGLEESGQIVISREGDDEYV